MICKSEMTIPGPSLALLLLTSFAGPVTSPRVSEWMNEPEDVVSLSCMYGFGISGLVSEYDASKRDRQWRMRCSDVGGRGSDVCQWTCKCFVAAYLRVLADDYLTEKSLHHKTSSLCVCAPFLPWYITGRSDSCCDRVVYNSSLILFYFFVVACPHSICLSVNLIILYLALNVTVLGGSKLLYVLHNALFV